MAAQVVGGVYDRLGTKCAPLVEVLLDAGSFNSYSPTFMLAGRPAVIRLAMAVKAGRYAFMACTEGLRVWRSSRKPLNQSGIRSASACPASDRVPSLRAGPRGVMTFLFWTRFGEAGGRHLRTAAGVGKPRNGLSSYRGDGVEVFVDVQDGQSRQLGGGRNDEIGDRRPPVLAAIGQQQLNF